jgi:hypothetical protein
MFMTIYIARVYGHVQRLVSVAKWRPYLRSVLPKNRVIVRFLWTKNLTLRIFI